MKILPATIRRVTMPYPLPGGLANVTDKPAVTVLWADVERHIIQ